MNKLVDHLGIYIKSIEILLKQELFIPALSLMYSLIDHMAYLDMPDDQMDVKGTDFEKWCKDYLDLEALDIQAQDLYAARCGILHSAIAESRLSREISKEKIKVQEIYYVCGDKTIANFREKYNSSKEDNWKDTKNITHNYTVLKIEDLWSKLFKAFGKFGLEIDKDEKRKIIVIQRLNKFLIYFKLL